MHVKLYVSNLHFTQVYPRHVSPLTDYPHWSKTRFKSQCGDVNSEPFRLKLICWLSKIFQMELKFGFLVQFFLICSKVGLLKARTSVFDLKCQVEKSKLWCRNWEIFRVRKYQNHSNFIRKFSRNFGTPLFGPTIVI